MATDSAQTPSEESQAAGRAGRILFLLLIQIFLFGLWAGGPRVAHEDRKTYCVTNLEIGQHFGHSVNCDFYDFITAADDLDHVLGAGARRQDRPGAILLVHFMTQPVLSILRMAGVNDRPIMLNKTEPASGLALAVRYVGFLIFNLAILALSYMLYLKAAGVMAAGRMKYTHAASLLGLAIFVNNLTKQFVWSPHTQLLSILAAVTAVYFFKAIQETEKPARLFCILALMCGAGMLFYAVFVIPIVVIGLGYLWRARHDSRSARRAGRLAFIFAAAILLFAVPYGFWHVFIVHLNGAFSHYDIDTYKGFVWLTLTAAEQGWPAALARLTRHFAEMFTGALAHGWGFALLVAGLAYALRGTGLFREARPLWMGWALFSVLNAAFFSLYGLTPPRISFSLVVALLPLAGFYLHRFETGAKNRKRVFTATCIGMAVYTIAMIVKFGPYG